MISDCLENTKMDLLREIFASATHDASAAICRWTNSVIHLTLEEVREIRLENACNELELDHRRRTMVVLTIDGEIGGSLILTFEEKDGRRLAALLLGEESVSTGPWTELEQSALTETGNILGCVYVGAIGRLIDRALIPSVPYFIQDYGAGVLEQALALQAASSDSILVCRTGFRRADAALGWMLLFVPTVAMRTIMENAIEESSELRSIQPGREPRRS
jgi:chemotaxis protein CheC